MDGFKGFLDVGFFSDLGFIWFLLLDLDFGFVDTGFCSVFADRIGLFSFADTKMLKLAGV